MKQKERMPAEWEEQKFVQLTWPHQDTDWKPYLEEAYSCFLQIVHEVLKQEDLLVVSPDVNAVEQQMDDAMIYDGEHEVVMFECESNDTWARDHGFITTVDEDGNTILHDFCFNGWGQKFASDKDNLINESLYEADLFSDVVYADERKVVLEGGSIESDGKGTIMTTTNCLFAPNRNWFADKQEAEKMLTSLLGAERVLWLDHGNLSGDATDGHIDTLARFCPDDTIVYVQCMDEQDEDYEELRLMEQELKALTTKEGKPYRLLPLPMAKPMYDEDGLRLPATYANFLIINGAVLMPTYNCEEKDNAAKGVLQMAFPDRKIVGVDCSVLVKQHGSLHCVTMQYFK